MPTSTSCPSCGHQMGLPGSIVGTVTCTACGKAFEVTPYSSGARSSSTKTALSSKTSVASTEMEIAAVPAAAPRGDGRPAGRRREAPPRPPGSRPELLDRLPRPFITSPPMIAGAGVFVLLYGLVMIPVVSAYKNRPDPEPPPPLAFHTTPVPTPPIPEPSKEPADAKKAATDADKKDGPKPDPSKSHAADSEKDPKSKENRPKKDEPPKPAPEAPNTTVAMRTSTPKPAALIPVAEGPKPEAWGVLLGFPGDCKFELEGQGLKIDIPGKLHILSPDPKMNRAPRLLTDAGGDFTAQVQIVGKIAPGKDPLDIPIQGEPPKEKAKIPRLPFTFQGAGLLLFQDEKNFMRLERTSSFDLMLGKGFHQVLFEVYRDGMSPGPLVLKARETEAMTLKIEKKGSMLKCSYSPDNGTTWLDVKRMENVTLPKSIKIGVSASNASTKPFERGSRISTSARRSNK